MKKLIIYVFSGTGNTLKVANMYKNNLVDYETTIYEINGYSNVFPQPNDYDLIGLGYPIYGFNPPFVFTDFIKKLPKVKNIPTFIFKSSGEPLKINDASSQKIIRLLKRRKYNVLQERHYVMPYNMIFRHSDAFAKEMYIYAKAYNVINSDLINKQTHEKVRVSIFKRIIPGMVKIIKPFSKLHGPRFKVDKDKCIKCMKCINNCPMNNITIKGDKIKFHHRCTLCVRCSFNCPTNAIKIGILNGWKVNGSYHLEKLENDDSIKLPALPNESKKMQTVYRKYYLYLDDLINTTKSK